VRVPGFETDVHITREEFEALARPWVERTVALTAATLFRTGLRRDQVAAVLLVGGSSRTPLVATMLHQRLGIAPTVLDQPELVVAEGSLTDPTAGPTASHAAAVPPPLPPASVSPPPLPPTPVPPPPTDVLWPTPIPVAAPARRSGRLWVWTLVAAAVVLALTAGTVTLVNVAGSRKNNAGHDNSISANLPRTNLPTTNLPTNNPPTGSRTTPAGPTASPSPSVSQGSGPHVIYEVIPSGSNNIGDVTYLDQDNQTIRRSGIPLPWRIEFTNTQRNPTYILEAQRKGGGDNGPVLCRITVDGKVLDETTGTGQYAAVNCVG
jgi:hypothetical protein